MTRIHDSLLPLFCLFLALGGCKQVAPEPAGGGDFQGKPGAAVSLDYSLAAQPRVGESLAIHLNFSVGHPGGAMEVLCTAGDGLSLESAQFAFPDMRVGHSSTHTIQVTPHTEGLHHVNVIVQLQASAGATARTFAVPVKVGEGRKARENGRLILDEAGEGIISLPARED